MSAKIGQCSQCGALYTWRVTDPGTCSRHSGANPGVGTRRDPAPPRPRWRDRRRT